MLLIIKSLNFNAVNVNEIHIFNVVNIIYVVNVNAEEMVWQYHDITIVEITHNLLNMNIKHGHKYNICLKNNQRCLCRLSSNFASDSMLSKNHSEFFQRALSRLC